jgi:hypothetical protein
MRPLPPYTSRPTKRIESRRLAGARTRPASATPTEQPRNVRDLLKGALMRERPRLRVLGQGQSTSGDESL